jgi:hypothetical protein
VDEASRLEQMVRFQIDLLRLAGALEKRDSNAAAQLEKLVERHLAK